MYKRQLYDGSYHPVDSNEMAFKTAAQLAYKDGIPRAKPTILEPIGLLKVTIPVSYTHLDVYKRQAHEVFHAETRMADAVALDPTHECFQIKTPFQRKTVTEYLIIPHPDEISIRELPALRMRLL